MDDTNLVWVLSLMAAVFMGIIALCCIEVAENNERERTATTCSAVVKLCAQSRGYRCGRVAELCDAR